MPGLWCGRLGRGAVVEEERPHGRIIDQRLRNRIMEDLLCLSEGDEDVTAKGAGEWFESFFDHLPREGSDYRDNSSISGTEWTALAPVVETMQLARQNAPSRISDEDLIASGWPTRVARLAKSALDAFLERGRFSEDVEEDEPSSPIPWP